MSDQSMDWLYDYITAFLKSPPWTVPIANFMDEHCIVFDNEEENKLIYTELHMKFCNLIETLLTTHLSELGVTNEQFVAACDRGRGESRAVEKLVFGQIVAVDDFLTFKKMMYKRNMELEVEVLKALKQTNMDKSSSPKAASAPPSSQVDADLARALALSLQEPSLQSSNIRNIDRHHSDQEQVRLAIRASLDAEELRARELAREQADLEHAIALSLAMEAERLRLLQLADAKTSPTHTPTMTLVDPPKMNTSTAATGTIVDPPKTTTIVDPPKAATSAPVATAAATTTTPSTTTTSLPSITTAPTATTPTSSSSSSSSSSSITLGPLRAQSKLPAPPAAQQQQQYDITKKRAEEIFEEAAQERKQKATIVDTVQRESGLSPEELQRRQTFLREQRARILAAKNKERNEVLRAFEADQKATAASIATSTPATTPQMSEEEKRRLAMRQQLTKQLKQNMNAIEVKRREEHMLGNLNDVSEQLKRLETLRATQRQQTQQA